MLAKVMLDVNQTNTFESDRGYPQGLSIRFDPDFLAIAQADALFRHLLTPGNYAWRQDQITLYGRTHRIPRRHAWYGEQDKPYTYSGITLNPEPWPQELSQVLHRINDYCRINFTNALLNHYRTGQDSMGWHRDNEPELGNNPVIASLSLGATRTMHFRHRNRKDNGLKIFKIDLIHGSLLVMEGETQKHWEHSLPKLSKSKTVGERVNLTFRKLLAA